MNRRTTFVICLAILLLGAGLRFHRLAERSLWLDEARVANYARQSLTENVTKTRLGSSSPITYPLILQATQRVHDSVIAIRSTSAVFSLLAVVVILGLPRFGFDRMAALVAGSFLAVSPSQIRYAQEVREYSLSVLWASLLVLTLVMLVNQRKGARALFIATALLAPLIQYGLVFLVPALLFVVFLEGWRSTTWKTALATVIPPSAAFALGAVVTYWLTLRGQLGREMSYLGHAFYHGSITDPETLVSFVAGRSLHLAEYLTFGSGAIALLALIVSCLLVACRPTPRDSRSVIAFVIVSMAAIVMASVVGIYPYGPFRQNLLLAPLVAITIGVAFSSICALTPERFRSPVTVATVAVLLASGTLAVAKADPYKEIQDIKSIIARLERRKPRDVVYVHYGSWPALRYYRVDGPEFRFGRHHRDDPRAYVSEFRALVGEDARRVWVVFSHASKRERQLLLRGLEQEWKFNAVVRARGARLYLGRRIGSHNPSADVVLPPVVIPRS